MPPKCRLFKKNGQSESSGCYRSCKHGKWDEPLGPAVGLTLVELQAEVDQGAEGGDHGESEDNVVCTQKQDKKLSYFSSFVYKKS